MVILLFCNKSSVCNNYSDVLWHLSLYTLLLYMLSSWRMYEMHLALFLKAGCDRTRGGVFFPWFKRLQRSQTCESRYESGAGLFLAPRALTYVSSNGGYALDQEIDGRQIWLVSLPILRQNWCQELSNVQVSVSTFSRGCLRWYTTFLVQNPSGFGAIFKVNTVEL
jgi:hypothetical protein